MTDPGAADAAETREAQLPKRDWLLLPLLAALTLVLLIGGAEMIARRVFYLAGSTKACAIADDAATGTRGVPNSVCREKDLESRLVEYRFNACGHRTPMQCGAPKTAALRVVMTGSSFAAGSQVEQSESFAALLPAKLSQATGRSVELYDAGIFRNGFPGAVEAQMKDGLAQRPDLVLLVITPWDIENAGLANSEAGRGGQAPGLGAGLKMLLHTGSGSALEQYLFFHSRLLFALRHTLYLSQAQYIRSYLMGAQNASFLAAQWNPLWKQNLSEYEGHFAGIETQAAASGVPLIVVFIPNRAEATMISMGKWPDGYDPYKLGDELRAMAERHDAKYIDILPEFRAVPNVQWFYMPVDGHLYASGHALVADMIARALTAGAVPELRASGGHIAGLKSDSR